MPLHSVKQGEHISTLADIYGFFDYHTIWDHPANESLKADHDPNVLNPGDVVTVPDKDAKSVSVPTTRLHTFVIKKQQLMLRIVIKTYWDDPIADTPCGWEVDSQPKADKTNADGLIEREIERKSKKGRVVIRGSDVEMRIGDLDPVKEKSGQIARLNNLGYAAGSIDTPDDELLRSAIEEFQCDEKIRDGSGKVTGVCDARTQNRLKTIHGS